ncbi:catechol 2,3-dioxygenase-like lactoylglutathione lyase family enzyme [Friedmanniella endophytica]|uniref:Catechol 2,3-dioxygenase-like lactoylglutathione lyase family enzyme n=1 Tax=Microlunatus kandeliicorticis TaxID=1759536 RepID=A0A7W3IQR9_9ACTN|nr:VOC family protein [Microlunatus kandeliicorticis]MBA8793507.1 catechol 2,3-dioxygenase-like lactoylglutathione lyase family enzyme [Microlunatus kandeliicorticis]
MSTDPASTHDPASTEGAPAARLAMVTVDCADPGASAAFWSALLGLPISYADENAAMVGGADGSPAIGFGKVEGYRPPSWPGEPSDKQFHLDLDVADIPAAEARAVALGATVPEFQPGDRWRVLLDPAGHPFCLASWS